MSLYNLEKKFILEVIWHGKERQFCVRSSVMILAASIDTVGTVLHIATYKGI